MKKSLIVWLAVTVLLLQVVALTGCNGQTEFTLPSRTLTDGATMTFGSYEYKLYDDGCAVITGYSGSETDLRLPDVIDGHRVCAVGSAAFAGIGSIGRLYLNSSLEIIEEYAFYGCTGLTDVTFNGALWSVGSAAFDETPWIGARTEEFLTVGNGVLLKYQGSDHTVRLPDGIRHLSSAFVANENVVYVETGDELLTVGQNAFAYCENLREVKLGKRVISIGQNAFEGCEALVRVNIPDSVRVIGKAAFNFCLYLSDVHLGSSVETVGEAAFMDCQRLKIVTLPTSLKTVGTGAFANCYSLILVNYMGSEAEYGEIDVAAGDNYFFSDAQKIFEVTGGNDEG